MAQRTDARYERSRAALQREVIALASTRSISEVTAAEISAAAEVNRSTFYQHAESPAVLLRDALRSELDAIRADMLAAADARRADVTIDTTLSVLRHVASHAAIYRRSFETSADPSGLSLMLTDHFEQSAVELLGHDAIAIATQDAADRAVALRYVASGTVGAIQAWLRRGMPESPEDFTRVIIDLRPDWWVDAVRADPDPGD